MTTEAIDGCLVPFDLLYLADEDEGQISTYRDRADFLAAYIEKDMAGMIGVLDLESGISEIVCVAVYERYENRGIATRLLESAIGQACERGCRELIIRTGSCGLKQLYLYQKCGFRMTSICRDYFIDHYDHPIYENGLPCRDQVELRLRVYSAEERLKALEEYWRRFIELRPEYVYSAYDAWSFGHGSVLADTLIGLVKQGVKTATTFALETFPEDEKVPEVGGLSILLYGNGMPGCIVKTVELREKLFCDIDASEAALEGEGDLSLEHWRQNHDAFFRREYELAGIGFHDRIPVLFERFELIYDAENAACNG